MIPDVIAAIVAFLLSKPSVTAVVGDRVYGAEAPRDLPGDGSGMPVRCVVVQASPGGYAGYRRSYIKAGHSRIDLRCYGPDPRGAMEVYRAIHPVLKQAGRFVQDGTLINSINQEIGASALREPDTLWPLVFTSYDVFAAEEELATA